MSTGLLVYFTIKIKHLKVVERGETVSSTGDDADTPRSLKGEDAAAKDCAGKKLDDVHFATNNN